MQLTQLTKISFFCFASVFLLSQKVLAEDFKAVALTIFFVDDADPIRKTSRIQGGEWKLGENYTFIESLLPNETGPKTGTYKLDLKEDLDSALSRRTSSAFARSEITVTDQDTGPDGSKFFNYELLVNAETIVGTDFLGLDTLPALAIARAREPQFFETAGIFASQLTLGSGSSIFELQPEEDEAFSTFQLTAPELLSNPIASIDLLAVSGSIDATVTFNTDSRLRFLNPFNLNPITASEVESLLESATGLNTESGLISNLPLFIYEFDLQNTMLPPGAGIGAIAENSAFSPGEKIPESTPTLGILGLGLLGIVSILKHRL
jgi:hypothetical protein